MLVPWAAAREQESPGYILLLEISEEWADSAEDLRWAQFVEQELRQNYYYTHARNLGQLRELQVRRIKDGVVRYRQACLRAGARSGVIKIPALDLHRHRDEPWWEGAK
jgi:hypothetical protein